MRAAADAIADAIAIAETYADDDTDHDEVPVCGADTDAVPGDDREEYYEGYEFSNSPATNVLDVLGKDMTAILGPVSICMFLVVFLVFVMPSATESSDETRVTVATLYYNEKVGAANVVIGRLLFKCSRSNRGSDSIGHSNPMNVKLYSDNAVVFIVFYGAA
jgi:hypothetical protein